MGIYTPKSRVVTTDHAVTRRLPQFTEIDYSNPLSVGLHNAFHFNRSYRDLVTGKQPTTIQSAIQNGALYCNNNGVNYTGVFPVYADSANISIMALAQYGAPADYFIGWGAPAAAQSINFGMLSGTSCRLSCWGNDLNVNFTPTTNRWYIWAGVVSNAGDRAEIWVDGVSKGSRTGFTWGSTTVSNGWIGSLVSGGNDWLGGISLVLLWSRALTDSEVKSLTDNPWQVFKDSSNISYLTTAAAAPTGYVTPPYYETLLGGGIV